VILVPLNPTWPVLVVENDRGLPTGTGYAMAIKDESQEHHTQYLVGYNAGGVLWWVPQPFVRLQFNPTMGRTAK
jgi:hypothetical protein